MRFGDYLKSKRKQRNITQEDLARSLNVSSVFIHQLETGKAIVMVDGLDEVADAGARQKVVEWVDRHMRAYSRCSFILTSRPGGYRANPLEAVDLIAGPVHQHRFQGVVLVVDVQLHV